MASEKRDKSEPAVALVKVSEFNPIGGTLFHEIGDLAKALRKGELAADADNYYVVRIIRPVAIEPPKPVEQNVVRFGDPLQAKPGARGPRKARGSTPTGGE